MDVRLWRVGATLAVAPTLDGGRLRLCQEGAQPQGDDQHPQ